MDVKLDLRMYSLNRRVKLTSAHYNVFDTVITNPIVGDYIEREIKHLYVICVLFRVFYSCIQLPLVCNAITGYLPRIVVYGCCLTSASVIIFFTRKTSSPLHQKNINLDSSDSHGY